MSGRPLATPATLFYSYAHADEALRSQLETHLSLLQRQGLLAPWHSREIAPGDEWANVIDQHLNQAQIILLLVSADFLASDYCYEHEMQRAMERHKRGEAHVIPIILRPCDWSSTPFDKLQALPRHAKPITTWDNEDEAFEHVAQQLRRLLEQRSPSATPPPAQASQNRQRMRQRLQQWYQDYLMDSLQQAAWLDLGLADKPDALYHPLTLITKDAHLPERHLPAGTSIVQVYEEAHQELLILGEPGSGKSTQLYILAQHLLRVMETDPGAPLPLIFALSSWAVKRAPLEQWMAEQLTLIYQVPKTLAQQWVATYQIIPLLDGLDEMEEQARPQCIAAINHYHLNHLHPLVVCSRSTEYTAASHTERFALQRAVVVQPLTAAQITTALARGGELLAGLRAAYQNNPALQELAAAPLFLNLLILTYQGTSVYALPTKQAMQQQQVFEQYVQRMVSRKGDARHYPLRRTIVWLGWLARQMREHNQAIFLLELIQQDWLPKRQRVFCRWSVVLVFGLVFGLTSGLLAGPGGKLGGGLLSGMGGGLLVGLLVGLGSGLLAGPLLVLIDSSEDEPADRMGEALYFGLLFGLLGGVGGGLLFGLPFGLILGPLGGVGGGLLFGLLVGLGSGLGGGLLVVLGGELLVMLGGRPKYSPGLGLLNGLLLGLLTGLYFGLLLGLIGGLIGGLGGGLLTGLVVMLGTMLHSWTLGSESNVPLRELLTERRMFTPNEGVQRSAKRGLIYGLLGGLLSGLSAGLVGGLLGGLLWGQGSGLFDVVQHYTLRLWLSRMHLFPWRVVPFLEDATARILLRRVGGGYQFTHRLLLDYFADLPLESARRSTRL